MQKLDVSLATYDEIAGLLEQKGIKINTGEALTLSKTDKLVPPVDFRLVTIRRDVMGICTPAYKSPLDPNGNPITDSADYIKFVDDNFQYILHGKTKSEEV